MPFSYIYFPHPPQSPACMGNERWHGLCLKAGTHVAGFAAQSLCENILGEWPIQWERTVTIKQIIKWRECSLIIKWQIIYANLNKILFLPCWKPNFKSKFKSYSEIMTSWGSRDCHWGSLFSRYLSHFVKIENACFLAWQILVASTLQRPKSTWNKWVNFLHHCFLEDWKEI